MRIPEAPAHASLFRLRARTGAPDQSGISPSGPGCGRRWNPALRAGLSPSGLPSLTRSKHRCRWSTSPPGCSGSA